MSQKQKPSKLLIVLFSLTMLAPSLLWYLGAFAPITSDDTCGFWTKVHFGIMLRCNCLRGHIIEWQVYHQDSAHAFINKGIDQYETWTVNLDGNYFDSRLWFPSPIR